MRPMCYVVINVFLTGFVHDPFRIYFDFKVSIAFQSIAGTYDTYIMQQNDYQTKLINTNCP